MCIIAVQRDAIDRSIQNWACPHNDYALSNANKTLEYCFYCIIYRLQRHVKACAVLVWVNALA